MRKILWCMYIAALISGLTGCVPMMTLTGDLGAGHDVNDRDKLEAVLERSGLTRTWPRSPIDESGHIRSGDDVVSFFLLKNASRFSVNVYYSPSSGALKMLGREYVTGEFSSAVHECISRIDNYSKEAFGDGVSIKIGETSIMLL